MTLNAFAVVYVLSYVQIMLCSRTRKAFLVALMAGAEAAENVVKIVLSRQFRYMEII